MTAIRLAILALVLSALALGAALLSSPGAPHASEASPRSIGAPADLDQRLAALDERIVAIETAVELLQLRPDAAPSATRQPAEAGSGVSEELQSRIEELERTLANQEGEREARSEEALRALRETLGRRGPRDRDEDERSLEEWTNQALDRNSTPEEMLDALGELRGEHLEDGTDARLPVLPEMIELARLSEDGQVRSDVWRQLSGVTDPSLLGPLLDALANDPYADAREEAAETLEDFLPDGTVESALRHAMEHDVDPGVREQAAESLARGRR